MIKNIIFDFGNVLFDLQLGKITSELQLAFGNRADRAAAFFKETNVFKLYEVGGISSDEFVELVRHAGGAPALSKEVVVAAWNSIFVDFPRHRLDFLLDLRQHYSVFLLSNINDLHEKWIAEYLHRRHGVTDFEHRFFDGVYYSHLIRLRKPDREIYEYVLADAELIPEECLFFDDLPENIATAQQLGIRGVVHPVGTEIVEHVRQHLRIDKLPELVGRAGG